VSNDSERNDAQQQDDESQSNSQNKNKQVRFKLWQFLLILLGVILITAGITVAATILISHKMSGLNKDQRADLKKIEYVYKTLNKDYYKKQDSDKLTQSAIDGMVKELKDPYSEYMTSEETKQFNEGVSGDFVGIGAEMQKKNDQISITSPMKDSPAEKAGLLIGDKILAENSTALWQWLQEGAYFYVCGDASKMAKDVEQALLDVIAKEGNLSSDEAEDYLNELREVKRYQRDVY